MLSLGGAGGMSYGRQGIGPLAFNLYPGNVTEGAVMAQFARDQGYKRPYVLQDLSIQYTKEVCEFFDKQWKTLGGGAARGPVDLPERRPLVLVAGQRGAAARAPTRSSCARIRPAAPRCIRQLRAAGIDLPVVASGGGMDGLRWLDAVPNLSNYYDSRDGVAGRAMTPTRSATRSSRTSRSASVRGRSSPPRR